MLRQVSLALRKVLKSIDLIFPGSVKHYACYRFVCELLKSVLYQRQQLPMTYDQMVSFQMQELATTQLKEGAVRKSIQSSRDLSWPRCEWTLRDLDKVLDYLEEPYSLNYVPRVLSRLESSATLATEGYKINMKALVRKAVTGV